MCPGMIRKVKKRYEYIDYVKALIIIIVVMVHTGFDMLTPISNICMIVLVVCSGITLSLKEKPLKEMIVSRFKRIMLPFWGAIAVYSVFEVWRAGYLGYSDYRIAYPGILAMFYGVTAKMPVISGITDPLYEILSYKWAFHTYFSLDAVMPTISHLWFLPAMFVGSVLYFVYTKYVKTRGILDAVTIVVLLWLAYLESPPTVIQFPFNIGRGFLVCACLIFGANLRRWDIFNLNIKGYMIYAVSIVITFSLLNCIDNGPISIISSIYPLGNIWGMYLLYLEGISVSIFLLFTLKLVSEKVSCQILLDIGKNTMTIYLWHMIFLTIFGLMILRIFGVSAEPDIFFLPFIPESRTDLRLLVDALTVGMCLFIANTDKRPNRKLYIFGILTFVILCIAGLTFTGHVAV